MALPLNNASGTLEQYFRARFPAEFLKHFNKLSSGYALAVGGGQTCLRVTRKQSERATTVGGRYVGPCAL